MALPTRPLGQSGVSVSAIGLGCMGMSEFYGQPRTTRSRSAVIHRCARPGHRLPRHRRHVRRRAQRGARRPGDPRPAAGQSCWRRSSATSAGPRASSSASAATPEYVRSACDASLKRLGVDVIDLYYQHRVDPNTPIEDDGRRDGRAGAGGEGAVPRPVRGRPRHDPPGEPRPPDRGPADGILALEPRARGRRPADVPRAGHRLRRLQPARPRASSPGRSRRPTTSPPDDRRLDIPRFQGENFQKNLDLVAQRARRSPARRGARRRSSPWRGCWPRAKDVSRSPGRSASSTWRKTSPRSNVRLTPEDLARIDAILPHGLAAGERYPEAAMRAVNR